MTFSELKVGDRVKTRYSGWATVISLGYNKGRMVKLKCDKPVWACPYFYESELELDTLTHEMKQTDKAHLQWIHDRIVEVYGENENVDFLIKMREIISNL